MHTDEMKQALQEGIAEAERAMNLVAAAKEAIGEAMSITWMVRNVSVDTIGVPAIAQSMEDLDKATVQMKRYIDAATQYLNSI